MLVQRLDRDLPLPAYAREDDAGLDLYAREGVTLAPGARAAVGTGVAMALPDGYAGFVLPRSGLALRHGLSLVNTPGLIDAGYRGEIRVIQNVWYAALGIVIVAMLFRDGWRGRSLGKQILGLRVVTRNEKPCGYLRSLARNISLVVPVVNLAEVVLVVAGKSRIGDRIAKTNVTEE